METWRVRRSVIADSHPIDEKDPDPHLSEKSDPDPRFSENGDPDPDLH
jgi:hypothetical protein